MTLIIKKRVDLSTLGDEYQDSYIIVRAMSVEAFEKLKEETVRECVSEYFIEGEIKQDSGMVKVTKENLAELPGEVFVRVFDVMTGKLDPKLQGLSQMPSTTISPAPQN